MSFIRIGTSGWSYSHWDKVFYPKDLTVKEHLKFYSSFFNTVEINTTFYHLPLVKSVKNWHQQVPKDFLFSIKASRYITHVKRLLEPSKTLPPFYQRIQHLKEKNGPILFQLPPSFSKDIDRLKNFISFLKSKHRYVFEFRHSDWYDGEVYEILKANNIALCITDLNGVLSPIELTSDFVYVRLHGPQQAYKGRYGKQLLTWKKRVLNWSQEQKKEVFIYFDNDEKSYATMDAIALNKMILLKPF